VAIKIIDEVSETLAGKFGWSTQNIQEFLRTAAPWPKFSTVCSMLNPPITRVIADYAAAGLRKAPHPGWFYTPL
jgi:hypothetical protein